MKKALSDSNIPYELVNYCEIDKHASKAYSAIHNVPESLNLWDVTKIKIKDLAKKCINLFTYGTPFQDISSDGLQKGFDENSGTRSSLIWSSLKLIKELLPKYVIWENIKNAVSSKHIHNVYKYMDILSNLGYTSYCDILIVMIKVCLIAGIVFL